MSDEEIKQIGRGDTCKLIYGSISKLPIALFELRNKSKPLNEIERTDKDVFFDGRPDLANKEVLVVDVKNNAVEIKLDNDFFTVYLQQLELIKSATPGLKFDNLIPTKKTKTISKPRTTKIDKSFSGSREEQIEACEKCNGNPILVDFKVDRFIGQRCKECFIIKNYTNV
jgi:hypothetical protein